MASGPDPRPDPSPEPVTGSQSGPVFFSDYDDSGPAPPAPHKNKPRYHNSPEEDFATFVNRVALGTKRKSTYIESGSEEKGVDDDDDDDDDDDGEEVDDPEDDDEAEGHYYLKDEGARVRYMPQRGNHKNTPPCDGCVKRSSDCYSQYSRKSRGACYECGRMKQKCIFTVNCFHFYVINIVDNLF